MILRLAANAAVHKVGGIVLGVALAVAAAAALERMGRPARGRASGPAPADPAATPPL